MSKARHVAVLQGGASREAEVSRVSAAGVAAALRSGGHRVTLLELNRAALEKLNRLRPDVVFPALHGPPGEDGTAQGLLEMLELPYVGSGVRGSAFAMDKAVAKSIFRRSGLPVAEDLLIDQHAHPAEAAEIIRGKFGDRVVMKPICLGSAIGVTRLPAGGDLERSIAEALDFGAVLVEPFIAGRELTVGVLDRHGGSAEAFPAIEIRTAADQWYDYVNRYKVGASEHIVPAPVSARMARELRNIALVAHTALGLRDLSRADFIVDEHNGITLLEVNTLPGMTPTSLYPDGARAHGLEFSALLSVLIENALERGATAHI